jgi:hypothetical protein
VSEKTKKFWEYSEQIPLEQDTSKNFTIIFPDIITQELASEHMKSIQLHTESITFSGSLLRLTCIPHFSLFITSGRIRIEQHEHEKFVLYTITFSRVMILGAIISLLVNYEFCLSFSAEFFLLALLFWVCGVGINVLISRSQFRTFIRRCIRQAGGKILSQKTCS